MSASVRSGGTARSQRSSRSHRSNRSSRSSRGEEDIRPAGPLDVNEKGLPQTADAMDMSKEWLHGLCTCGAGCNGCMYAMFCPCCAGATALTRFDGSSWASNCLFVNPCMARSVIREGYGIEGHCCADMCCPLLCTPCAMNQLLAETDERGSVIDHWAKHNRYRPPQPTQWKFPLCACKEDPGKFWYSCFMPWCALGSIRTDLDGSDWCFNCCFLNSCAARGMVRAAYNIQGTLGDDITKGMFCLPCALSQMMIEVQHRGRINAPDRLLEQSGGGVQMQRMAR